MFNYFTLNEIRKMLQMPLGGFELFIPYVELFKDEKVQHATPSRQLQ